MESGVKGIALDRECVLGADVSFKLDGSYALEKLLESSSPEFDEFDENSLGGR